jgi:hypothetical protein
MSNWIRRIALLSVGSVACYAADLDTDASQVFVCEEDDECPLGQACADGVCSSLSALNGPVLTITSPPSLHVFAQNESTIPLSFEGSSLVLTSDDSDDGSAGYIEIYVDGALVDAVTDGTLEDGIELTSLPMPTVGGLHHVVLSARHIDGGRFDGVDSEAHVAFWVDDGREYVAIVEPPPGTRVDSDDAEVELEVASLNFTLVNPGFVGPDEVSAAPQGYVHIFVDADVPSCLPACNFDYQTSIIPPGLARVTQLRSEQALILPDGVGTVRIQIVAQAISNEPYYRDPEGADLVYYEVPVQSVVGQAQ